MDPMSSTTFTLRIDPADKERLEALARSTGRSRSFLAAEAIKAYLDINEWQVSGIRDAMAATDRGEGVSHEAVRGWVASWESDDEREAPGRSRA
jgi:predicted transcriptional regulator